MLVSHAASGSKEPDLICGEKEPRVAGFSVDLGFVLETDGKLEEAIAHYRQVVSFHPEVKFARFRLGNALMKQGKFSEAAASYGQELQVSPESHETMNNLGSALQKLGKLEQAIVCYQKAISFNRSYAEAYNNLGITYNDLGRLDEAVASYLQAIACSPDSADAYSNIAATLTSRRDFKEAVQLCKRAIELEPNNATAYLHIGNAYCGLGLNGDAVISYQRAIDLAPEYGGTYSNLAETLKDQGKLQQADECFKKAIAAKFRPAYSNLLYFYAFTCYVSPTDARIFAEGWEAYFLTASERRAARERAPAGTGIFPFSPRNGRKLRLGILSGELGPIATAEFLEPVLEEFDRSRVHLTIFSTCVIAGYRGERFLDMFDRKGDSLVPLFKTSAVRAAEVIRAERIDVLIETAGHTYMNSLEVIAHRAAPVQCSYIGFWSTTGLTEMDWLITGKGVGSFVDPHFTEGLWRLPRFSSAYYKDTSLAESGWTPDPDGTVWLGSFNNNAKMREETLGLWAKVLHALPEAKLLFADRHVQDEETHQRLLSTLLGFGVDKRRVVFIPYVHGHVRHMMLYDRLDIALDTIPFNSGTTAYDALWMGVPLVTIAGNWLGGIMAGKVLEALGHPEWIANSDEDFVSIVCTLARDVEKRKQLRRTQRSLMANSELCDAAGLARCLEDAFEAMYDRWAAGAQRPRVS
jgi:protein O-GlcNAc transferase